MRSAVTKALIVNGPLYTLSFSSGAKAKLRSLPLGYSTLPTRTSVGGLSLSLVGISSSERGVFELMWKPGFTRKTSFALAALPAVTGTVAIGTWVTYCFVFS